MKKTVFILSAVFALVACSKEKPVTQNDGPIDPSKVVFNFTVKHADDTKAIKTDWADGDIVYVFFADNSSQWVKLTRSGSSWTFTDKDGGYDYTGLVLASSGNVTAVYANAATPSIDGGITFADAQPGYLLTATAEYTVTSTTEVTTLSATLDMRAPANLIQVYVPGLSDLDSGNEYVLNMTNVKPFTVGSITPGDAVSAVSITYGTANFPLKGVKATIGSDSGYYFWGVLNETDASARTYNFQVVERNAEKKYAISSKSKTGSTTLTGPKAIKLTSLTDNGNFVSLGYAGGPLWATGNIGNVTFKVNKNAIIVDPLLAGNYFKFGDLYIYDKDGGAPYTGTVNPLPLNYDAAYTINNDWHIPTQVQFQNLINSSNTDNAWVTGWTSLGTTRGGDLITSKTNGISLFFAAGGRHYNSNTVSNEGSSGYYWTSTPHAANTLAYFFVFSESEIKSDANCNGNRRLIGLPIRPVRDL